MRKFDNPLGPARRAGYPEAARRLKETARSVWAIEDSAAVTVCELACDHADCPGVETVIAVLRAGEPPIVLRLPMKLPDVTPDDLIKGTPQGCGIDKPPSPGANSIPYRER